MSIFANRSVLPLLAGYFVYAYCNRSPEVGEKISKEKSSRKLSTKRVSFSDYQYNLVLYSTEKIFIDIINHIYTLYPDNIKNFSYNKDRIYTYNDWKYRRNNNECITVKKMTPDNFDFTCNYEKDGKTYTINFKLDFIKDNNQNITKILRSEGGSLGVQDYIHKQLTISCSDKGVLTDLMDEYMDDIKEELNKYKKESKETIRIYYYHIDYWSLLSKSPKRSIDTIYLKENEIETIIHKVETFFSDLSREIYVSYGIPYKCVHMVYGVPGTGKTSLIKSIASHLDCDIFVLPITKDMLDTDLVGAFGYINEQDSKKRIIVIEDIDTLFDDRKEGDNINNITLQGLLNCLDGFTCIEGTMLFITANKPEVLDSAFIRSCRIDHKLELGYADKYQIKQMFEAFLPDQVDHLNEFYSLIEHKDITTAALQEFLFYNRECGNILELMDDFNVILDKNDPKSYEILKEENKNFYS